ncbi:MAG: hydrogenase subunit MbhD domain-containing protein [Spirochaetota bacterium]
MISSVIFILLSIVMLVTAVISLYFRDLLASVVSYSVMSLILTVMFFHLDAPDVAIAEAGIGAALTVCIFVIAIKMTRRREE